MFLFRSMCAFVAASILWSPSSFGQFIEINATAHDGNTMRLHGSFSLVFDTRTAPTIDNRGDLYFYAISGSTFTSNTNGGSNVFRVALPDRAGKDDFLGNGNFEAGIYISRDYNEVGIFAHKEFDLVGSRGGRPFRGMDLFFQSQDGENPIPALNAQITSLPDDPEAYAFVEGEGRTVEAFINASHTLAIYSTDPEIESRGGIYYTVGYTTDPNATPCSAADINEDGILDVWDVTLFSVAYMFDRRIADVNGDGVVGLADLSLYIQIFSNGCDGE